MTDGIFSRMSDPCQADMTSFGIGMGAGQIQLAGSHYCLCMMLW